MLGATGAVDIAPALVVTVDDSTYAAPFFAIYDVFVDHLDNVWVTDLVNNAVYRFDDLAGITGAQSIVPDLYLESTASTISDSFSTMDAPVSLVVDLDGTLYVGTESYDLPRFDDALALTGFQNLEASAYLDTAVDFPYMVALDQSEALWVGHLSGALVRLRDPTSYTGYADVSGDLDLQLSWVADGGTGYPDGGTITFVPTQGPHAGY